MSGGGGDFLDAGAPIGGASVGAPVLEAPVAAAPPPVTAPNQGGDQVARTGTTLAQPGLHQSIPKTAYLLIPVALLLAYAVMLALGPTAQPATTTARHGVSRALEQRRRSRRFAAKGAV